MNDPTSILIRVYSGETIVHEYRRSTTRADARGVVNLSGHALGWLQAWSGQLSDQSWNNEIRRAETAQDR